MDVGYIKTDRQIKNWRFWYSETAVKLWILLLINANWKDGWFMGEEIPRGSLATSIASLAAEMNKSPSTIKRWLKRFEEAGQITIKATNRFTLIKLINYGFYQGEPENVTQQMTQPVTQQMNQRMDHQVNHQVNHNRRKKEEKEGKKERREERGASAPSLPEIRRFIEEEGLTIDPVRFYHYYEDQNWRRASGAPIRDWKEIARSWQKTEKPKRQETLPDWYDPNPIRKTDQRPASQEEIDAVMALALRGAKNE